MRLIKELLEEAVKENQRNFTSFVTDFNKQKLREQWILGKFFEIYNGQFRHKAVYAEKYKRDPEQPTPDFKVFDIKKEWMFDVEITEALDEGRKRTLEYRTEDEESGKISFIPKENYLPVVEKRISQKCEKKYPKTTLLIIYFNVFSSIYDKFESKRFLSLSLPKKCNLQIWLLDSGGDKILKL